MSNLLTMKNTLTCFAMLLLASGVAQSAEPPSATPVRSGRGLANSNDVFYRLGPDSKPMDGVPKGKFVGPKGIPSSGFPGTQHTYFKSITPGASAITGRSKAEGCSRE